MNEPARANAAERTTDDLRHFIETLVTSQKQFQEQMNERMTRLESLRSRSTSPTRTSQPAEASTRIVPEGTGVSTHAHANGDVSQVRFVSMNAVRDEASRPSASTSPSTAWNQQLQYGDLPMFSHTDPRFSTFEPFGGAIATISGRNGRLRSSA